MFALDNTRVSLIRKQQIYLDGVEESFKFIKIAYLRIVESIEAQNLEDDPADNASDALETTYDALLLTADIHYFPQVIALITELDAPTAQVLIEAKIIEVSSDFRDRLGVRWSPDGSIFDAEDFDGSLSAKGTGSLKNTFLGSTAADAFRSGVVDASMELNVLIQFLRKNTDANVLAEPKINVSDNELAKLFVGSQIPFISDIQNTPQGTRNDAFDYRDVGVTLEVTPQINNSEEVALKIRVESSKIRSGETLFGAAILDTRNFRTDLLVKSGQTVILGGIIQEEDGQVIRKIPILGSIPILGWAFKKKDKTTRQVELMVFLRPVISRSPEEADALTEEIERSTPRLKEWREESEATKAQEREEAEQKAAKPKEKEAQARRWFWQKKSPAQKAEAAGPTKLDLKTAKPIAAPAEPAAQSAEQISDKSPE